MRRIWNRLLVITVAGTLWVPAPLLSQSEPQQGIGIRLLEAPASRANDPRAQVYIVDHVDAGTTISRQAEVTNGTDSPVLLRLYAEAAELQTGTFTPAGDRQQNELSSWMALDPGMLDLEPGETEVVTITIDVPDEATDGERYAAALVERPPEATQDQPVGVTARVGIRVYLSVGDGEEPRTDFEIDELDGGRDDIGRPTVTARVRNIGGRAIDLNGELQLEDGPGGVTAGPFPAQLTSLPPGGDGNVRLNLAEDLPDGPWRARITLRSGALERDGLADLSFERGLEPVQVEEAQEIPAWLLWLAGLLLMLLLLALLLVWRRKRRDSGEPARA